MWLFLWNNDDAEIDYHSPFMKATFQEHKGKEFTKSECHLEPGKTKAAIYRCTSFFYIQHLVIVFYLDMTVLSFWYLMSWSINIQGNPTITNTENIKIILLTSLFWNFGYHPMPCKVVFSATRIIHLQNSSKSFGLEPNLLWCLLIIFRMMMEYKK